MNNDKGLRKSRLCTVEQGEWFVLSCVGLANQDAQSITSIYNNELSKHQQKTATKTTHT